MTDTREIATRQSEVVTASEKRMGEQMVMVREAMLNPDVNADKAKVMAELMILLEDRALKAEFNRDLNAAIMEMPVISKEGRIVIKDKNSGQVIQSTQFAKFEDIDRVCRPILQRHNLAVRFEIDEDGGKQTVRPIITHRNGHTERGGAMSSPLDTSGSKNNVQGAGSTVTYLKRYTYLAALNIITEGVDDDANQGRGEAVTLPNEREQLVMTEAQQAFDAGRYADHFASLGPKDRAWLMQSGKHAEFGGQVALPSKRSATTVVDQGASSSPPPPPPPAEKPKAPTAREWVAGFKGDVEKCAKVDDLDLYMDEARDSLDKLKVKNETLWNECQEAFRARRQTLESGAML